MHYLLFVFAVLFGTAVLLMTISLLGNTMQHDTQNTQQPPIHITNAMPMSMTSPTPMPIPAAPMISPGLSAHQALRSFDYRTMNDPLVPPVKRSDWDLPLVPAINYIYPSYKKMGTLIDKAAQNSDPYKFLFLIGRRKYPNADYYEYYVIDKNSEMSKTSLKFDLPNLHRELYTGDKVRIDELGKDYEVIIDKMFGPEYNPYIL